MSAHAGYTKNILNSIGKRVAHPTILDKRISSSTSVKTNTAKSQEAVVETLVKSKKPTKEI